MITDQVKSFEDACQVLGVQPSEVLPFAEPKNQDQVAVNAFAKITTIAKALNEGWTPDWDNWDQNKYYPWFDFRSEAVAGSGFSFDDYGYGGSDSGVGARLVFKTRELAEYAGKQFTDTYKEFMVITESK
jgi:hypothetical protein